MLLIYFFRIRINFHILWLKIYQFFSLLAAIRFICGWNAGLDRHRGFSYCRVVLSSSYTANFHYQIIIDVNLFLVSQLNQIFGFQQPTMIIIFGI